jgi:hypothetical protein
MFCLGGLGDVERRVAEGDQRLSAGQYDWIVKLLIPRHEFKSPCDQMCYGAQAEFSTALHFSALKFLCGSGQIGIGTPEGTQEDSEGAACGTSKVQRGKPVS